MEEISVDTALKKPGSESQQLGRVRAGGKHRLTERVCIPSHGGETCMRLTVDGEHQLGRRGSEDMGEARAAGELGAQSSGRAGLPAQVGGIGLGQEGGTSSPEAAGRDV